MREENDIVLITSNGVWFGLFSEKIGNNGTYFSFTGEGYYKYEIIGGFCEMSGSNIAIYKGSGDFIGIIDRKTQKEL